MPSVQPGSSTLAVEVLGVSPRGLWLLVRDREYFLDSKDFPWFANATVRSVYDVVLEHGHILHWPQLDVDLELDSLTAPDRWPLVAR
jgi:hypothetical protein